MNPPNSKFIPFIVLAIVCSFGIIDTFTTFQITENMVQVIEVILVPMGLGGLVNKGWDTYKAIKTKPE